MTDNLETTLGFDLKVGDTVGVQRFWWAKPIFAKVEKIDRRRGHIFLENEMVFDKHGIEILSAEFNGVPKARLLSEKAALEAIEGMEKSVSRYLAGLEVEKISKKIRNIDNYCVTKIDESTRTRLIELVNTLATT
jgi:hypothetical protein